MSHDLNTRVKRTLIRRTMITMAAADATSNKRTNEYENVAVLPGYNETSTASKTSHFETDLHGNVNIFLGGAMVSSVIMVIFLMCYCCHRSVRKNRPQEYPRYWRTEPDVHSLEVFTTHEAHTVYRDRQSTIEGNQDESTYGAFSCPVTLNFRPGPPPTYDSLVFDQKSLPNIIEKKPDGVNTPGTIIPSMVSTLLGLNARSTERNETTEQEITDEGLPSYEAALKLNADGYV